MLTALSKREPERWDTYLPYVQYALRTTPRTDTGLTPYFAVHGREAYMPFDIDDDAKPRLLDKHELIEQQLRYLDVARELTQQAFEMRQASTERQNALNIKRKLKVTVGDLVMVRREPLPNESYKLIPKWTGPWTIIQEVDPHGLTYVCELKGRRVKYVTVHVSRMKLFHTRPTDRSKHRCRTVRQ